MNERRFIVTKEDDSFLLGHFDNEQTSGVYLTPEYLGRLRQIRQAVAIRLGHLQTPELPDALKNLLGVIDRLTNIHAEQMRTEGAPPTTGDLEAYAAAEQELESAMQALLKIVPPLNDPGRK